MSTDDKPQIADASRLAGGVHHRRASRARRLRGVSGGVRHPFRRRGGVARWGRRVSRERERQPVRRAHLREINSSPTQFERSRRLLQDGDDSIYVLLPTFGSLRVRQREVHSDLRLGDAAVVVNGEQRGRVVDGEGLGVRIPRPPLMSLLPRTADFAPVTLSRDAAATKLLLSYLVSLVDFPPGHVAGIDEVTSRHVVDLLALAIGPSPDARERVAQGGVRAARLRTIMADGRAGIGTRDLSVTSIASQHRISARYVQMLFEAEGTTYSEFVLGERLAKAAQLLADPAHLSLRISRVT